MHPDKNAIFKKNIQVIKPKPEEKAFQPEEVALIRTTLWNRVHQRTYDVYGYAMLLSSYTGMREAELPSLTWDDVDFERQTIHIHSQQLIMISDQGSNYYYEPSTQNEKGVSQGGRYFPFRTGNEIYQILTELKEKQAELGIQSKWVFARKNGDWIKTGGYSDALYNLCKGEPRRGNHGLGLKLSNNHAFRMALNSYEFIPKGLKKALKTTVFKAFQTKVCNAGNGT